MNLETQPINLFSDRGYSVLGSLYTMPLYLSVYLSTNVDTHSVNAQGI